MPNLPLARIEKHISLSGLKRPTGARPGQRRVLARSYLKGEHVTVVGLGKSGRAAAKVALLAGARVTGFDANSKLRPLEADAETAPLARSGAGLRTVLGPQEDLALLRGCTRVVVSPGVPLDRPFLSAAREVGSAMRRCIAQSLRLGAPSQTRRSIQRRRASPLTRNWVSP